MSTKPNNDEEFGAEQATVPPTKNVYPNNSKSQAKPLSKIANLQSEYIEGIQNPIMAIDRDFTVTYMNCSGAKLLNKTVNEVVGQKCFDLFKTDDCNTPNCACFKAMKTGKPAASQTIARAGGGALPIQYTGSPLTDPEGNIKGAVELVNDITDLKKTMEISQKLSEYLEAIQTPIMTIDTEFTVNYMNTFGATLLGSTPAKVKGKKCYDLFKTDDCQTPNCACYKTMKTGKPASSQTIARAGGGALPIQYTGSPLTDPEGNIIGATEFVTDITDLKNTMTVIENVVKSATEASEKIDNLSEEIMSNSKNVGEMCKQTATASEELSKSMIQLQTASNNVSTGAESLSKLTQDSAKNVEDLAKTMMEVNKAAEEVNILVDDSNKMAAQMGEGGKSALTSLSEIKESALNVGKTMTEVNASVKSVAGLAGDISDIAGQVNMLALNAAIEAARAGEAGRGFAVVADAVKQLAGKAGTAAKTAVVSIDEITKSGNKAAEMAQGAGQAANKGNIKVSEALTGAQQVATSMGKIREITLQLQHNIQKSVKAIETVNGAIQQVASFSEESASAAQESAASIEEQTATTEEVTAQNQKISEAMTQATELSQKIAAEVKNLRAQLSKAQTQTTTNAKTGNK